MNGPTRLVPNRQWCQNTKCGHNVGAKWEGGIQSACFCLAPVTRPAEITCLRFCFFKKQKKLFENERALAAHKLSPRWRSQECFLAIQKRTQWKRERERERRERRERERQRQTDREREESEKRGEREREQPEPGTWMPNSPTFSGVTSSQTFFLLGKIHHQFAMNRTQVN